MTSNAEPLRLPVDVSVRGFLVKALLWNLALFGLIRLAWIDRHFIGALIEFQQSIIFWYGTAPNPGIIVNSSCSGADVMALCSGVLLAYPIPWVRRIAGALLGLTLILILNAVRIASLYAVASAPATLNVLHIYVWPAVLTVATVLYVFYWIRVSERRTLDVSRRWTRFVLASVGALVLYAATAPWTLTSTMLHTAGIWTATAGAAIVGAAGAAAQTSGNILLTERGAFQVTQECLFTPVLPVYFAAVFAYPLTRRARIAWIALALPLFFALGIARLLVLAVPPALVQAPMVVVHGFYQIVAGAVALVGAAHLALRHTSGARASARTAGAMAIALTAAFAARWVWEPLLLSAVSVAQLVFPATIATLQPSGDQQGALALMPVYQAALVCGLWFALTGATRPRTLVTVLAATWTAQVLFLIVAGMVTAAIGVQLHAVVVRGFALAAPLLLAAFTWTGRDGTVVGDATYKRFWHDVGETFPTLTGAASTDYYFESEKRLISEALPSLAGIALLKTDLWDEAKNTRILQWAADRGARVFGIDISEPIARQARTAFGTTPLRPVVSDVRTLPFANASFDAIYSMGTIEHFAETEATVAELARLLRPGGRLILGVPNRHDPFLRPLFVALIYRLGLYGYGYEKSYSRKALRRMMEDAGLEVGMESGLLFIPGWLRMIDLWCHTRARPLTVFTRALVRPFVWIDRMVPAVRRHGYLLASVGAKPPVPAHVDEARNGTTGTGPVWQASRVPLPPAGAVPTGVEFVIDAKGCSAEALRSLPRLQQLFGRICDELCLQSLAPPLWHVFPGQGGVTGLVLLSESHLTIHTYPELGAAAINLYCCRAASLEWPWEANLRDALGAEAVDVRQFRRG